jgi:predicted hotdog family 3-hydroxylacyl-ACP dehydratase
MSAFPPITELLPHAAPLLLLRELLAGEDGFAQARLVIEPDGPFVHDKAVDALIVFEAMAQAVAACLGLEACRAALPVRVGMVVACRSMELERATLAVGDELTVEARRVRGNDATSSFETTTWDAAGRVVALATMTLVHGRDLPA